MCRCRGAQQASPCPTHCLALIRCQCVPSPLIMAWAFTSPHLPFMCTDMGMQGIRNTQSQQAQLGPGMPFAMLEVKPMHVEEDDPAPGLSFLMRHQGQGVLAVGAPAMGKDAVPDIGIEPWQPVQGPADTAAAGQAAATQATTPQYTEQQRKQSECKTGTTSTPGIVHAGSASHTNAGLLCGLALIFTVLCSACPLLDAQWTTMSSRGVET